jgi:hypothetical protein
MTQATDDGDRAFTPYTAEKVAPWSTRGLPILRARLRNFVTTRSRTGDRPRDWEDTRGLR